MKFRTLMLAVLLISPMAHATSFNCAKAATFVEKTICADATLGKLDDALTDNYNAMLAPDLGDGPDNKALRKEQRAWIAQRNKCTTEKCLTDLYRKRVDDVCDSGVVTGMHPTCVQSSDIDAGPVSSATQGGVKSENASAKDNQAIESWAKTCAPLTAPTGLDGQVRAGNVAFRGVKIAAVDSADAGGSSLVSVRLTMSATDFRVKFPEFAKTSRLPKSTACPGGVQRSISDKSMTGAAGATIECNCDTGGD